MWCEVTAIVSILLGLPGPRSGLQGEKVGIREGNEDDRNTKQRGRNTGTHGVEMKLGVTVDP